MACLGKRELDDREKDDADRSLVDMNRALNANETGFFEAV